MTCEEKIIVSRIDERKDDMHNHIKVQENVLKMYSFLNKIKEIKFEDIYFGISGSLNEQTFISFSFVLAGENILIDSKKNNIFRIYVNYGYNSVLDKIVFVTIKYYRLNLNLVSAMYTFGDFINGIKLNNGYINIKQHKVNIKDGICCLIDSVETIKSEIKKDLEELDSVFSDLNVLTKKRKSLQSEISYHSKKIYDIQEQIKEIEYKQEKIFKRKLDVLRDF